MNTRKRKVEKDGSKEATVSEIFQKAMRPEAEWSDKVSRHSDNRHSNLVPLMLSPDVTDEFWELN